MHGRRKKHIEIAEEAHRNSTMPDMLFIALSHKPSPYIYSLDSRCKQLSDKDRIKRWDEWIYITLRWSSMSYNFQMTCSRDGGYHGDDLTPFELNMVQQLASYGNNLVYNKVLRRLRTTSLYNNLVYNELFYKKLL